MEGRDGGIHSRRGCLSAKRPRGRRFNPNLFPFGTCYTGFDKVSIGEGEVVVAQLVERSLLTPEIRGSNPNIGKVLSANCKLNRKDEKKKWPIF